MLRRGLAAMAVSADGNRAYASLRHVRKAAQEMLLVGVRIHKLLTVRFTGPLPSNCSAVAVSESARMRTDQPQHPTLRSQDVPQVSHAGS